MISSGPPVPRHFRPYEERGETGNRPMTIL